MEFEARTFVPSDFQGVLRHVEGLFSLGGMDPKGAVTGGVALRDLTEFIIGQRSVGSAITQSVNVDEDEDDDEEDDGLEDLTSVYGVTSVIQLVGGEQDAVSFG